MVLLMDGGTVRVGLLQCYTCALKGIVGPCVEKLCCFRVGITEVNSSNYCSWSETENNFDSILAWRSERDF